jgi:hypothetical protein
MKRGGLFVLLLLMAGWPAAGEAQGLGDAAARERQKRKQKPASEPAKVFTDEDLASEQAPASDAADAHADASAKPAEQGVSDASDPELDALERERQERKLQQAEWRVRFANAREQLAIAEAACWQEVVRTEFYQGVPVQMKVKEFVESEAFRQAKQALADLQEEFRRTGLPPGWAREP